MADLNANSDRGDEVQENAATKPAQGSRPGPLRALFVSWPRGLSRRVHQYIWNEKHERAQGFKNVAWRAVQIVSLSARKYQEHNCPLRASSLTFTAFLSFVPLLALVFAILKGLGYQEVLAEKILRSVTAGTMESTQETIDSIVQFVNRTQVRSLSSLGAIGLFFVSISVLRTVEKSMNVIWDVKRGRSPARMTADYISLIVIAPEEYAAPTGFLFQPAEPFDHRAGCRPAIDVIAQEYKDVIRKRSGADI